MDKIFAVYILASGRNGTLYTGITSNLIKRIWWKRGWKLKLIEERNPEWRDLYQDIIQ
jgi:putative endonuclease